MVQPPAQGAVRLRHLHTGARHRQGASEALQRQPHQRRCLVPYSLYREDIATFDAGGDYKQADATGFISLFGLPTRVQALVDQENSEKDGEKNVDRSHWHQLGDEGRGRVIDLLAENADIVARYQGGNNAGHTVVTDAGKFILNLLPSGILHPEVTCVLGTGMVIDLDHLAAEMQSIQERGVAVTPKI